MDNSEMEREWQRLKTDLFKKEYNDQEMQNFYCIFRIGWIKAEFSIKAKSIINELTS